MYQSINLQRHPSSNLKSEMFLPRWIHMLFEVFNIQNNDVARLICQLVPAQCPFERDVCFLGRNLFHIPSLCKLNPAYDALMTLRFRALSYLERQ